MDLLIVVEGVPRSNQRDGTKRVYYYDHSCNRKTTESFLCPDCCCKQLTLYSSCPSMPSAFLKREARAKEEEELDALDDEDEDEANAPPQAQPAHRRRVSTRTPPKRKI